MDADQILAVRLERSGLVKRATDYLAGAAACPASDFLGLYGRALVSTDADELATQLGQQAKRRLDSRRWYRLTALAPRSLSTCRRFSRHPPRRAFASSLPATPISRSRTGPC